MKIFKSKTIDFNILISAAVALLTGFGIAIPVEVATGVLAIGNFILRLVTKEAVSDK